jgi:hypothetical protein
LTAIECNLGKRCQVLDSLGVAGLLLDHTPPLCGGIREHRGFDLSFCLTLLSVFSEQHHRRCLDTLRRPSGEKVALLTAPVWPLRGSPIGCPVSASQSRSVLSDEAETMRRPSGEKAALRAALVWPLSGSPMGCPVSASQSRSVLSNEAETMRRPSGEKAAPRTVWPLTGSPLCVLRAFAMSGALAPEPGTKVVRTTAAVAAVGAVACGVCCVLPFALPAAVLAVSGGVLAWFGSLMPWVRAVAVIAVSGGWLWVSCVQISLGRQHNRSPIFTVAMAW